MAKKMLIDAAHAEESRVVVLNGNRIEEFDFEAAAKRPLKGNIYLAKVTRVEPSLQAAFVDFGGNRHGFLAFSEIHPDYYQIPVADRQALVAQQEAEHRSSPSDDDYDDADDDAGETETPETASAELTEEGDTAQAADDLAAVPAPDTEEPASDDAAPVAEEGADMAPADEDAPFGGESPEASVLDSGETEAVQENGSGADEDSPVADPDGSNIESVSPAEPEPPKPTETRLADDLDDAIEEEEKARRRPLSAHGRPYKIQEVIKRRQILLVQVVKEERGTKGAALTTYLSLAGRYCVLMPNTARGGGISRKITSQVDRKRLKTAAQELEIPKGMGLIVRTAGANRTKAEVKRDYEYLLRVWENVRDLTLRSTAPALVYEEGSLIKRAIRDLYNKDIDSILVEGEEAYKEAKGFMRTLMPSHAKAVQPYRDPVPVFQRYQVEGQLDSMFSPVVTLRSGGYIVINQTEALVAIDVNSGRATRERSIEETALRTNLEAAEEAARQLRLRDLAGLIVIDFIDMEDNRNNRSVERRLKEHLKVDRARIQLGRISAFGLLEMSRQRLRAGVLEGSTIKCPHCEGVGLVRSVESAALRALRAIEDEGIKGRTASMTLKVPSTVALYILNQKRAELQAIEARYELSCFVEADDSLPAGGLNVARTHQRNAPPRPELLAPVRFEPLPEDEEDEAAAEAVSEGDEDDGESLSDAEDGHDEARAEGHGEGGGRRRRRRRRRGGRKDEEPSAGARVNGKASPYPEPHDRDSFEGGEHEVALLGDDEVSETSGDEASSDGESVDSGERRRRRRGRRGGRRNRRRGGGESVEAQAEDLSEEAAEPAEAESSEPESELGSDEIAQTAPDEPAVEPERFEPEPADVAPVAEEAAPPASSDEPAEPADHLPIALPEPEPVQPLAGQEPPAPPDSASQGSDEEPPRKGWWQRRFGG